MQTATDPPWLALPDKIDEILRPAMPDVVQQIIEAIPVAVPDYARPLEGRFGVGVRQGVEVALERFLSLPGTRRSALSEKSRQVYNDLGRGEVREGRSLEALLAAYRVGARITFRALSAISAEHNLDMSVVVNLGESILAYIEELSAASVEGYAFEQSERAGERDRRRVELLELLLHGRADEAAVNRAAALAGWTLPSRLVAITMPLELADGVRFQLGSRSLATERTSDAVALVPAPASTRDSRALERALTGRSAVIGPVRHWQAVPESLRLAELAATIGRTNGGLNGRVEGEPNGAGAAGTSDAPLWVEQHLADLLLSTEPEVLGDLAAARLAPLDGLRPNQRARLAETLLSWLRHWGQRRLIAEELNVHPQTVGYRMSQLRDLFGGALDDPQGRFELELVLRAGRR